MRKILFKKILGIIDAIELYGISLHDLPIRIYEELIDTYDAVKMPEIKNLVKFLAEKKIIKVTENGIDLTPAATIYSKSNQNSGIEALSIFETFLMDKHIHDFFQYFIRDNEYMDKDEIMHRIDSESLNFMCQTILFDIDHNSYRFQPKLVKGIMTILKEYQNKPVPLISCCLTSLYTSIIVSHDNPKIDYKNTDKQMINYKYKEDILTIIPRRGIPHDRDETKALQVFYKDTLFHEFHHACPICQINIPHMLIASHIKPFRDCAHIYEAIDHNNGLLLCRNHDYLFDQGYITFDETGYIILSTELLDEEEVEQRFCIRKNFKLPDDYLTEERKKFLQYHRLNIFKQKR